MRYTSCTAVVALTQQNELLYNTAFCIKPQQIQRLSKYIIYDISFVYYYVCYSGECALYIKTPVTSAFKQRIHFQIYQVD